MASTIRFERSGVTRTALREALLRGDWLDVASWAERRRAGRSRFMRTILLCAWALPLLVIAARARCVFLPDLECGAWVGSRWGILLVAALLWAGLMHLFASFEWWLCEEKYRLEVERRAGD